MSDSRDIEQLRVEAEESVVSIGFISPHIIDRMSAIVTWKDFFDPAISSIWQLLVNLRESGEGNHRSMVLSECKKRGITKDVGGIASLNTIFQRRVNHANADYYAREVARFSELRRIEDAMSYVAAAIRKPDADPQKILQSMQSRTEGIGNSKDAGFRRMADIVDSISERKDDVDPETPTRDIVSTGFPTLDSVIYGLLPGKLYLLGGRSGMGKSAFACNLAMNVALDGKAVWICSLEMESEELTERIISSENDIDMNRWRKPLIFSEKQKIKSFKTDSDGLRLWFTDKGSESFGSIRAKARLRKSLEGIDLIVVDNLQLIKPMDYKLPKNQQIKQLTEAFKLLAKDLGVAIVLLCQLSVDSEPSGKDSGKSDKEPDNRSWADSKRIIDDADVAMILHRESRESTTARLIVTKHRGGPTRPVDFHWEGQFQRFSDARVKEQLGQLGKSF